MRSLNASPSVELTVLMLAMLSETASIHRRWTESADPEMSRLSNTSCRPEGRAQAVVLAVERGEGELVAQAGLGGDDRLAVEVHVVAVLPGGLQRAGGRPAGDGRRPPLAQLGAQPGLHGGPDGGGPRRAGGRPAGDGRRPPLAQLGAQRGLEVGPAGEEARCYI